MNFLQLIGGEWTGSSTGASWDVVNPATEQVVDTVPYGAEADARAAVDAAQHSLHEWQALGADGRGKVLTRAAELIAEHADAFAPHTVAESGKPIAQALSEWRSAPSYLHFAAAAASRLEDGLDGHQRPAQVSVRALPVGVVAVITAWNFPVYNVVRAVSSALAAGCAVVIRPSELTPRSAMLLAGALHEADAPDGVVNLVNGDPAAMAAVFLDDPRCRKLSFTGSTRVGRSLIEGAARTVTGLALELGGNAPVIVLDDVDVEATARAAVAAKLRNGGQVCVAPQRFYVHRSVAARFVDEAVVAMGEQLIGDGADPATTLGPLITRAHRDRVAALVDGACEAGAGVVTGGRVPPRSGFFYAPTIVTGAGPGVAVHDEEVFGPVMLVEEFADVDDAIARANAVEHGLAAYVVAGDAAHGRAVAARLDSGMVGVNTWALAAPGAPFGGVKQSGLGRESGWEGLLEYVEPQAIFDGTAR